ncbi:glycoside hydrolase [Fluoribacter dumoffii]|uniref:sialidase family protein n=1 Tax=Fluoribacter dumoffii TaxID=463 RepID=UPI00026C7C1D|nr:sialidase family protein [Fluoribacter dumoffii]MCW8416763.1 glycoside hydrolase [Fluoribacter dumoffii]MCW8455397.1 glycoside hydrolase [Fluoribacter dumoffii]MCW8460525.1 glycoside hydrolase [Fluoribacter dumoffii]MCW8484006.1 glycoside hydrolase [Fluoribacter dumoffii]
MKPYHIKFIGLAVFLNSTISFALPFNIVPRGKLPTTVFKGESVDAAYTVTNSTRTTRANNFVKWLPPNVKQVTDPTDPTVCGSTFTLGPNGSINQSCTLKLSVSGEVNRADPNPQHHLFVCFPGGKTCAGPTPENSLNVTVDNNGPGQTTISLAVGAYGTNATAYPLVYLSSNNGMTWPKAVLPSITGIENYQSLLFGVACTGKYCTAVGNYFTNDDITQPISYSSKDRGTTWSAVKVLSIAGIPATHNDNRIVAVSCASSNCTAVGYSSNSNGNPVPLTYSSSDYGTTWSKPNLLSLAGLPSSNQGARLGSVSCSGTNCTAVGFYNDSLGLRQPVSYYSMNNGVTWSSAIRPSTSALPVGYQGEAKLTGVSCLGTKCSAIGEVPDPADPAITLPISYTSNDAGHSWSQASVLSITNLPPGNEGAILNGISCAGTRCVAVGLTRTPAPSSLPVYYTSSNNGVTWSGASMFSTSALPAGFDSAGLISVSCIGANCSAVGSYDDASNNGFPLTYFSADNGVTWTTVLPSISSISGALSAGLFGVGGSESGNLQT